MVYFYCYAKLKERFKAWSSTEGQSTNLGKTMSLSFLASALAEMLALVFYYPFDLIKTRMQTNHALFQYNNLFDACFRICEEPFSQEETGKLSTADKGRRARERWTTLQRFYKGMSLYGSGYILFMAIEFSVYESLLYYIHLTTHGQTSIIQHLAKSFGQSNSEDEGATEIG